MGSVKLQHYGVGSKPAVWSNANCTVLAGVDRCILPFQHDTTDIDAGSKQVFNPVVPLPAVVGLSRNMHAEPVRVDFVFDQARYAAGSGLRLGQSKQGRQLTRRRLQPALIRKAVHPQDGDPHGQRHQGNDGQQLQESEAG